MSKVPVESPTAARASTDRFSLRAGPLTMVFEAGDLRTIKLGGCEIIRRIYAAVRDRNWATVSSGISDFQANVETDSFRIAYLSTHRRDEIHFVWRAEIEGQSDGTIRFTFDGEARTTFLRNRIGFCVLHPAECAGSRCRVQRAAGPPADLMFPRLIEPAQPVPGIQDLTALAHEVAPGIWAELQFDGDRFEMEDQRNWIDASFKTFCTPLHLPFPVEVSAHTRIRQEILLRLVGHPAPPATDTPADAPVRIALTSFRRPLPGIGLGCASHGQPLSAWEAMRLAGLRLGHLRVEVKLGEPSWPDSLGLGHRQSVQLRIPLEIAVCLPRRSAKRELDELVRQLRLNNATIARVLLFHADATAVSAASLVLVRSCLAPLGVPIGAGTDADFCQLNQSRPAHEQADFVHWSMNPQVHAFDETSIAETPGSVAPQLESARAFFPGKPIVVSPVTFKPRFNPAATVRERPPAPDELPPQVDSRQLSSFAAAWTLAMIKQLAENGAASITLFETTGWRGVLERDVGSTLPARFPSQPGQLFPLFHVLGAVGAFVGGEVIVTRSTDACRVEAIALARENSTCLWLANLTATCQTAVVTGFSRVTHRLDLDWSADVRWMAESDAIQNCRGVEMAPAAGNEITVELAAFGLVKLELEP